MSQMHILLLPTNGLQFTDVTAPVQHVLDAWYEQSLFPGDALCCVTMMTPDAGVIVSDVDPAGLDLGLAAGGGTRIGRLHISLDMSELRRFFARTSEIFMVRGTTGGAVIAGARRVFLLGDGEGGKCEVALSVL